MIILIGFAGLAIVIAIGCFVILYRQKKDDEIIIEKPKGKKVPKKGFFTGLLSPKTKPLRPPKPNVKPAAQKKVVRKEIQLPASLSLSKIKKQKKSEEKAKVKELKVKAKELKKTKDKEKSDVMKKIRTMLNKKQKKVKKLKKIKPISSITVPVIEKMTKNIISKPITKKPVIKKPVLQKKKDSYIEVCQTLVGWRYRVKKHGVKDSAVSKPYLNKEEIMKIVESLAKDLEIEIKEPIKFKR